jgi:hypothetical protein
VLADEGAAARESLCGFVTAQPDDALETNVGFGVRLGKSRREDIWSAVPQKAASHLRRSELAVWARNRHGGKPHKRNTARWIPP